MDLNQSIQHLSEKFKGKDWFFDVGVDQYDRLVIYTKFMNNETLYEVPDRVDGIQVLVHLAASKTANKEQFATVFNKNLPTLQEGFDSISDVEVPSANLSNLCQELDRLEKLCGSNVLESIFYEEHDGENCITNLSNKYPEVRKTIHNLYDQYGFDVIYDELEIDLG